MLSASHLVEHRGGQVVLDDVSATVHDRSRIGVVGPNGVGKSTLLRVLGGLEEPDGGRVERSPRTLTVGYLPQEPDARPGETLVAYLARRTGVGAAVKLCVTAGLMKMNAASRSGNSQIQYLIRYEHRLPQLDAISRTNSTTVKP